VFLVATSSDELDSEECEHSLVRIFRNGRNEGMVRGHKAEATSSDLVNPFGVQAERKKNKGERKPAGSNCA
jgi:hypothetical protein